MIKTTTTTPTLTTISRLAQQSLLAEVSLAPKPGLVDPFSAGAHHDMDYDLFLTSIQAWSPYLKLYLKLGVASTDLTKLFDSLRRAGGQAERMMLTATDHVNTHKGANFSYAVLLGALGWCLQTASLADLAAQDFAPVFAAVQTMTAGITAADFKDVSTKTNLSYGEQLYVDFGVTGIRGEAEAGYPALQALALPWLRAHGELPATRRYLELMLYLIAELEDVNILHRGGLTALTQVQAYAKDLRAQSWPDMATFVRALQAFDAQMISWHLSPGGTADLLALAIFFDQLATSPLTAV